MGLRPENFDFLMFMSGQNSGVPITRIIVFRGLYWDTPI